MAHYETSPVYRSAADNRKELERSVADKISLAKEFFIDGWLVFGKSVQSPLTVS
jgi:hypothetical protein